MAAKRAEKPKFQVIGRLTNFGASVRAFHLITHEAVLAVKGNRYVLVDAPLDEPTRVKREGDSRFRTLGGKSMTLGLTVLLAFSGLVYIFADKPPESLPILVAKTKPSHIPVCINTKPGSIVEPVNFGGVSVRPTSNCASKGYEIKSQPNKKASPPK